MSNAASPPRLLRLPEIIGDKKANPPIPAKIPVSKTTWWAGVKTGRFPPPVKLGPRITAWREEQIDRIPEQCDSTLTPPKAAIEGAKRKRAAKRVELSQAVPAAPNPTPKTKARRVELTRKPAPPTVPKPSTPHAPARRPARRAK
jgi:prophage regulatory protein